jgi:replication-associated recombination protein RarA
MSVPSEVLKEYSSKPEVEKWWVYLSAFIKSVRRCMVDDAIYWGCLLDKLGKTKQVWNRILIHMSEDIGPGNHNLPATIKALHDSYYKLKDINIMGAKLNYIHAIFLMANSSKSRIIDYYAMINYEQDPPIRPVPDYAFDFHGKVGRNIGRGQEHFFEEASVIYNKASIENFSHKKILELRDNAKTVMLKKEQK